MLATELRQALRNLGRAPRFSAACIFTLAFAFAGTATLLNLLESFVFRRLAVTTPEQLAGLYPTTGERSLGFAASTLQSLIDRQQALTGVCGVTAGYGTLGVRFETGPIQQRPVEAVTGDCYQLLGVSASIGRLVAPADAPLAGEPARVVVLSERVWRREFGASPDVLGRTVSLEGTPLTVIGVLPPAYRGVNADEAPDIALPITLLWRLKLHPPLAMHAIGRLRAGTGLDEAAAHLTTIWPEVFAAGESGGTARTPPALRVVPLASGFSQLRDRYRRPLYALTALACCLLLLAAVNVGGLSLARWLDRRETFAVQLALGAGRTRLAVQLLCEAVLIGLAATLLAIPLARWSAELAMHLLWPGDRPSTLQATPLPTTLLVTAIVGALASLVVAVPGWIALRVQQWDLGARAVGHGARTGPRRGVLATQLALSLVLAFCAALFVVNLQALRQLPLGYEPDGLQRAQLQATSRTTSPPTIGYVDTLLADVAALHGVESVAVSQYGFGRTRQGFDTVLARRDDTEDGVDALVDRVSPGFFRTTGIPLRQGRDFTWNDVRNDASVVILNQSLADRLFPGGDALGRAVRFGASESRAAVIGIAADAVPGDPRLQQLPQYYHPLRSTAPPIPALLLRAWTGSVSEPALRAAIEPPGHHEVLRLETMDERLGQFVAQERLLSSAGVFFAALAGLVTIAGLYAAMSQSITRRQREIGIRMAVGATPGRIRGLVYVEVGWTLLAGLGLGAPAALAGGYAARSLLSGTSPNPLLLLGITGAAIAGVALLVSAWPARQAAATPVATALRAE